MINAKGTSQPHAGGRLELLAVLPGIPSPSDTLRDRTPLFAAFHRSSSISNFLSAPARTSHAGKDRGSPGGAFPHRSPEMPL